MLTYASTAVEQKDKLMRRTASVFIGKDLEKGFKNPENVTFTRKITLLKKFVPGVGKYNPNYDK